MQIGLNPLLKCKLQLTHYYNRLLRPEVYIAQLHSFSFERPLKSDDDLNTWHVLKTSSKVVNNCVFSIQGQI